MNIATSFLACNVFLCPPGNKFLVFSFSFSNTLSGFVLPPCENSSREPQLDIATASCDYRIEQKRSEMNEQDDSDEYETYYNSGIYSTPKQEHDL